MAVMGTTKKTTKLEMLTDLPNHGTLILIQTPKGDAEYLKNEEGHSCVCGVNERWDCIM